MTIFLWDASHYDGTLTTTILSRAHSEGIVGFTHKLGEGLGNVDPQAQTALAAAHTVGFRVIGGYWFNHGNDRPADEVAAFIAEADRHEPWWKEFPGWFWQADLERSPSGLPSPAWAKEFCDRLRDQTGRTVIAYASHGMYGDTLKGLGHPLWNANYPSTRQASFRDLYPGDSYSGWSAYSGQTPVLAQYASSATIAGRTTCDANAFRGTLDQLLALIGAEMTTASDVWGLKPPAGITNPADIIRNPRQRVDSPLHIPAGNNVTTGAGFALGDMWQVAYDARDAAIQANATLAGIVKSEAALQAALSAFATSASVDTAALAAQIKAIGDQESAAVASLAAQVADAEQRIADLEAQLTMIEPIPAA